jgi:hypothetical protein
MPTVSITYKIFSSRSDFTKTILLLLHSCNQVILSMFDKNKTAHPHHQEMADDERY